MTQTEVREVPLVLTRGGRPRPARLYLPAGAARCAVVFCAPFFDERKSAQRALVLTARHLAARGAAVLRFDYEGCGDAAGSPGNVFLADWVRDVRAAAARARALFPSVPVGLLGLRGGGMLACLAEGAGGDFMVLCQPVSDGKAALRRELQRKLIRDAVTGTEKLTLKTLLERMEASGRLDLDGTVFSARLYHEICEADVLASAARFDKPALVLQVGPAQRMTPPLRKLCDALPKGEGGVVVAKPVWERMDPEVPRDLMDAVTAWVEARAGDGAGDGRVEAPGEWETGYAGDGYIEELCAFECEGETLRGVVCRPRESVLHERGTVLVHGWGGCRAGPHRLLVDLARTLARAGAVSLRFDLRGRGESGGAGVDATVDGMIADTVAAIACLQGKTGCQRVAVAGICSGGNVAIGAATLCGDVDRLAVWSTLPFMEHHKKKARWKKSLSMLRQYGRKLLSAGTWKRMLRGEINYGMTARAISAAPATDAQAKRSARDIMAAFAGYGGRVLFGYGGNDPEAGPAREVYEPFVKEHGLAALFHEIPGANHNYYGEAWRGELIERTGGAILEKA